MEKVNRLLRLIIGVVEKKVIFSFVVHFNRIDVRVFRLVFGHLVCSSKDIYRIIVLNLQCDTWWRAWRIFHRTSVAALCLGIDTVETWVQLHRTIVCTNTGAASKNARQIPIEWVALFSIAFLLEKFGFISFHVFTLQIQLESLISPFSWLIMRRSLESSHAKNWHLLIAKVQHCCHVPKNWTNYMLTK